MGVPPVRHTPAGLGPVSGVTCSKARLVRLTPPTSGREAAAGCSTISHRDAGPDFFRVPKQAVTALVVRRSTENEI